MTYEEALAALRLSDAFGDCVPDDLEKAAREVAALTAPTDFVAMCRAVGIQVRSVKDLPDHHVFVMVDGKILDPSASLEEKIKAP